MSINWKKEALGYQRAAQELNIVAVTLAAILADLGFEKAATSMDDRCYYTFPGEYLVRDLEEDATSDD